MVLSNRSFIHLPRTISKRCLDEGTKQFEPRRSENRDRVHENSLQGVHPRGSVRTYEARGQRSRT